VLSSNLSSWNRRSKWRIGKRFRLNGSKARPRNGEIWQWITKHNDKFDLTQDELNIIEKTPLNGTQLIQKKPSELSNEWKINVESAQKILLRIAAEKGVIPRIDRRRSESPQVEIESMMKEFTPQLNGINENHDLLLNNIDSLNEHEIKIENMNKLEISDTSDKSDKSEKK